MPPSCTWIHLSDLHQGARGQRRDWPVVRDAFARDLDRMQHVVGAPDLILFTGDLAFRAAADEYDQVDALFDWLFARLGRTVPVVAVPGNHDLARPTPGRWSFLYSEDQASREEREQALLTRDPALSGLFSAWQGFATRRLRPPDRVGLLPGDNRHSLDLGGVRLGLLGLNSAWRQVSGLDFRGRVEISPHQVHELLPDGADAFRDAHHLVLMLQHHPPDWLSPTCRWRSHVATAAHGALFGHMHENLAEQRRAEDNEDLVLVQARSLCGLEHYGADQEERRFGYRWGRAALVDGGVDGPVTRVWTWSRALVESDRWRFVHPERSGYTEAAGMRLTDVPVPRDLRPAAAAAEPPRPARALDDLRRFEVLCGLLPDQVDELLLRLRAPLAHLPPRGQPTAERAHAIVRWLATQTGDTSRDFDRLLHNAAPGAFE